MEGYNPKHKLGLAGGSAIGYRLDAFKLPFFFPSRIEFKGLYSQLNLDDEEYGDKDKAEYIELVRSGSAAARANCGSK